VNILISAGPTREKIDPIRFISNYSTGTFGYELAGEALRRGNSVTLVSGPTCLKAPRGVKFIGVESAREMRRAIKKEAAKSDCIIMAAAVSDWRPRTPCGKKIKRRAGKMTLELAENPDILKELGRKKRGALVGFALETDNLERNALKKLKEKNLDLIIANRLTGKDSLFGEKPVSILMIDRFGNKAILPRKTKKSLAKIILDKAFSLR